MADPRDPQYGETENPRNPPQAVLNRGVRSAALKSYVAPLVVLCLILGLALLYWARRAPGRDADDNTLNPTIGTTGDRLKNDDAARDLKQGGGDPASKPGSTQDELKERGAR